MRNTMIPKLEQLNSLVFHLCFQKAHGQSKRKSNKVVLRAQTLAKHWVKAQFKSDLGLFSHICLSNICPLPAQLPSQETPPDLISFSCPQRTLWHFLPHALAWHFPDAGGVTGGQLSHKARRAPSHRGSQCRVRNSNYSFYVEWWSLVWLWLLRF